MEKPSTGAAAAAPTGCYKCGRAGHWARDCTFAPLPSNPKTPFTKPDHQNNSGDPTLSRDDTTKVKKKVIIKKQPRRKLNEDLLLSKEGLGFVLEHIPRITSSFKGPGHEIGDLRRLMDAFILWHSHLMPSMSFHHFLERVEKLGATRRVRICLRELRERIDRGEKPTTLHEVPVESTFPEEEMMDVDGTEQHFDDEDPDSFDIQEDLFDQLYKEAMGKGPELVNPESDDHVAHKNEEQGQDNSEHGENANNSNSLQSSGSIKQIELTEEQRARMEANRLKALERAAARSASKTQDV